MSRTERHRRLRLLLHKLNQQRKQQAAKIDILCNDLIGAHRAFLHRLSAVGFVAEFYKSLLGSPDLNHLLARADRLIRRELPGAGVAFYLRQGELCEPHSFAGDEIFESEPWGPQEYFTSDLIDGIYKSNKICVQAEIRGLDPAGSPQGLDKFSMATLPLSDLGRPLGFVLLWRPAPLILGAGEIARIEAVTCGLSQAVRAARVPLASGE